MNGTADAAAHAWGRLYLDDLVVKLDDAGRFADVGVVEVDDDGAEMPADEQRMNPLIDWLCSGTSGELDPDQVGSGPESQVRVVDRAFAAGDAVRLAGDETSQAGTVEAIRRQCLLYVPGYSRLIVGIGADRILCGNFIDELGRLSVQYEGWYGSMNSIASEMAELKFCDGTKIRMPSHLIEEEDTLIIGDFYGEDHPFVNDRLFCGAFLEFRPALLRENRTEVEWLQLGSNPLAIRRPSNRRRLVAQVTNLEPTRFAVDWHFCFPYLTSRPLGDLPSELDADKLVACNPTLASGVTALADRLELGSIAYICLRQDDRAVQVEPHTSIGCALYELLHKPEEGRCPPASKILPPDDEEEAGGAVKATSEAQVPEAMPVEESSEEDSQLQQRRAAAPGAGAGARGGVPRIGGGGRRRRGVAASGATRPPFAGGGRGRDRKASDGGGRGGSGGASSSASDSVLRELQKRPLRAGQLLPVRVVYCTSRVDVRWQDGRLQTDVSACDLIPFDDFMESQFFPGDFVLSADHSHLGGGAAAVAAALMGAPLRYALVLENDVRQKLAKVQWFQEVYSAIQQTSEEGEQQQQQQSVTVTPCGQPEILSTIDIKEYQSYEFRPRSIVMLKAQQLQHQQKAIKAADAAIGGQQLPSDNGGMIRLGEVVRVVLETGLVRVAWSDGTEADLWPCELFSLEGLLNGPADSAADQRSESSEFFRSAGEESRDDSSWETESEATAEDDVLDAAPAEDAVVDATSEDAAAASGGGTEDGMAADDGDGGAAIDSCCWLPHHAVSSDEAACARQVGFQLQESLRLIADCLREAASANASRLISPTVVHRVHQALDTVLLTAHGLRSQLHDLRNRPSCLSRGASSTQRAALHSFSSALRQLMADAHCLGAFTDPEDLPDKLLPLRHALLLRHDLIASDQRVVPTYVPRIASPLHTSLRLMWEAAAKLGAPESSDSNGMDVAGQFDVPEFNAMQEMMQLLYGQLKLQLGSQISENAQQNLQLFRSTICRVMQVDIAEVAIPGAAATAAEAAEASSFAASSGSSSHPPMVAGALETAPEAAASSVAGGDFQLVERAPAGHLHYAESGFAGGAPPKAFVSAWRRELALLGDHLPPGVTVKAYEDRMDLMAFLVVGPAGTPYSGALFLFDLHLPATYPSQPPRVLYRSMCSGRLNPNLYECGKVCVSLLGTWDGQGSERWSPKESNLLQVLVSVQGLILVEEPLFNEPGYEKGTPASGVKSREYNEVAVVRTAQSMANLVHSPPDTFAAEVARYAETGLQSYLVQLAEWLADGGTPGFPLLPLSAGARLSLGAALNRLRELADRRRAC